MPIKQTVPTNSGDYVQFGNATTPVAAQVGGYEDSTGNGHLELYTTASGTVTERARVDSAGNVLINQTSADTGAKLSVTGGIKGTITSGTAVASTSGTSIDFTSIPSWVKRITVMFNGVSVSGTSIGLIRLGTSSGIETTGYSGTISYIGTSTASTNAIVTVGIPFGLGAASDAISGIMTITNLSGNIWVSSITGGNNNQSQSVLGGATKTLASALTRVSITTSNGTDTFDAGSVNILYEG